MQSCAITRNLRMSNLFDVELDLFLQGFTDLGQYLYKSCLSFLKDYQHLTNS